ncbi:unnamed protein product, partial [Mesorhabditis belari]|uniref:Uncharacterized protein n=1 Tax=Mesorhabditis belari TaxID=2138241 RepID=A0AAF3FNZ0_9BILA
MKFNLAASSLKGAILFLFLLTATKSDDYDLTELMCEEYYALLFDLSCGPRACSANWTNKEINMTSSTQFGTTQSIRNATEEDTTGEHESITELTTTEMPSNKTVIFESTIEVVSTEASTGKNQEMTTHKPVSRKTRSKLDYAALRIVIMGRSTKSITDIESSAQAISKMTDTTVESIAEEVSLTSFETTFNVTTMTGVHTNPIIVGTTITAESTVTSTTTPISTQESTKPTTKPESTIETDESTTTKPSTKPSTTEAPMTDKEKAPTTLSEILLTLQPIDPSTISPSRMTTGTTDGTTTGSTSGQTTKPTTNSTDSLLMTGWTNFPSTMPTVITQLPVPAPSTPKPTTATVTPTTITRSTTRPTTKSTTKTTTESPMVATTRTIMRTVETPNDSTTIPVTITYQTTETVADILSAMPGKMTTTEQATKKPTTTTTAKASIPTTTEPTTQQSTVSTSTALTTKPTATTTTTTLTAISTATTTDKTIAAPTITTTAVLSTRSSTSTTNTTTTEPKSTIDLECNGNPMSPMPFEGMVPSKTTCGAWAFDVFESTTTVPASCLIACPTGYTNFAQ